MIEKEKSCCQIRKLVPGPELLPDPEAGARYPDPLPGPELLPDPEAGARPGAAAIIFENEII